MVDSLTDQWLLLQRVRFFDMISPEFAQGGVSADIDGILLSIEEKLRGVDHDV